MTFTKNRKAYFDYEILEDYESGIVLTGTEVKSVRAGHININDSYVRLLNGEAFLINTRISPYEQGNIYNHEPARTRKLLLSKKQISFLSGKVGEKGLSVVPLKVYLKNRYIKVLIALAKGKQVHDKRQSIKERDAKIEMQRALKSKY